MDPSPIKKKKVYLEGKKSYFGQKSNFKFIFLAQKHVFFDITDT